ncbi:MAG: 23S rRNA (uracil(1939)-C(5))-methyltransferase RlmD [Candidatus Cybelea sp.]
MTSRETAPNLAATLRRGVELELAFTDLLANGQGVGRADGAVVFCFGPIPGELARVRISEVKPRYAVADLVEVLRESPARARPFCPVFGACGGCQLQQLRYPAQLEWKRRVVQEALRRIGGLDGAEVSETIGMSEPRAYRNKMALVVDHRGDSPTLGFYRQRTHDVVPIDACPIVTPKLNADLARLHDLRTEEAVAMMLRDARHLIARSADSSGESILTVTTAHRSESARRAAPLLLHNLPGLAGITNSFDLPSANAIAGRHHRSLGGEAEIEETIGGVRYRFSAASFFQVNVEMVTRIFDYLGQHVKTPRRLIDLYCGVGTFALFFAKQGWQVYGVEENALAIAEAAANARRNGLAQRARFRAAKVERLGVTPELRDALNEADVCFLDPPRKGCDEATLDTIAQARVGTIWYLSCDPATLARDSKFLVAKGYRLGTVQPFDMFPQTGHVEALAQLEYP